MKKKSLIFLTFIFTSQYVFCNYAEDIFYNIFAVTQSIVDTPFKILNKALTTKAELPNLDNFKMIIVSVAFSFLLLSLIKHAIDLFTKQETVQTRFIAIRILIAYFAIKSSSYIIDFIDSIFYLITSSISSNKIDHFIDMQYYMQSIIGSDQNIFTKGFLITVAFLFSIIFCFAIFFIVGQIFMMGIEKIIYQLMFPIYLSFLGSSSTEERTKSAIKNYISINVNILLVFMQLIIIASFFSGQARIAIRNIILSTFVMSNADIDKFLDVFLAILGITSLFFTIYTLYKFPNLVKAIITVAKEKHALKKEEKERLQEEKKQIKKDKEEIKKQNKKDKEKLKELRKDELKIKMNELKTIIRGNKMKLFNFRKPLEVATKISEIYAIIKSSHFEVGELRKCKDFMDDIKIKLKKIENKASFNYYDRKYKQKSLENEMRNINKSINEKLKKANMLSRLSGKRKDFEKEAMLLELELKELKSKAINNKKLITLDKIKNKVVENNLNIQMKISKIVLIGMSSIPNKLGYLNQGIVNEMLSVKKKYDWNFSKQEIEDALSSKEITQEEFELFFNIKELEKTEIENLEKEKELLEAFLNLEKDDNKLKKYTDELQNISVEIENLEKELGTAALINEKIEKIEQFKEIIKSNREIPESLKEKIGTSLKEIQEHPEQINILKNISQDLNNVIVDKKEIFHQNVIQNIEKLKTTIDKKDEKKIEKLQHLENLNKEFLDSSNKLKKQEMIVEANYIKVELQTLEKMKENKNYPEKLDGMLVESCIKTKEVELRNILEKLDIHNNNTNSFNIENQFYKKSMYEQEETVKKIEEYSLEMLDRKLSHSEKKSFEITIMQERKEREIKIEENIYKNEITKIEKIYEVKEKLSSQEEKQNLLFEKQKEIEKIENAKNIRTNEISKKYTAQIDLKYHETKQYKLEEIQNIENKNNNLKTEILKYQKELRLSQIENPENNNELKKIAEKHKLIEQEIQRKSEELNFNKKKILEYQKDISKIDMLDRQKIQDSLREELKKDKNERDTKLIQELQIKLNNFYESAEENLYERNKLELQIQEEKKQFEKVNQQSRKNRSEIIRARKIKEQAEQEYQTTQYYTQELSKRIKRQDNNILLGNFGVNEREFEEENTFVF